MTTLTFGSLVVSIKSPIYGDTQALEKVRINRRSRANEIEIFDDPIWTEQEILRFKFENLKEADKQNLSHFFKISVGQDITIQDYKGRTWTGTITTPAIEFVQDSEVRPGDCCDTFSVEFEFEGVL